MCESDGLMRMACSDSADSMLQFQLERGRRRDETLPKDEAEIVSSSWLNGKEACYGVVTSARGEVPPERGKRGDGSSWTEVNFNLSKNEENPRG
jgi:hypothetical protein